MSKKLEIQITPTQARNLVWAINAFEMCYEGGTGIPEIDKRIPQVIKNLADLYNQFDEYAVENGK
jgi:hypothetical protein